MAEVPSTPLVIWTIAARRKLRRALARPMARPDSPEPERTMNDLSNRVRDLFPDAQSVIVQDLFTGFRPRDNEFILLVEVGENEQPSRYVVKFGPEAKLEGELRAWDSCRPPGLRHDLVFMALEPRRDGEGKLIGLIYQDAQQFLNVDAPTSLEDAFLGAVRFATPSPSSVASVMSQLYERIGQLLYHVSYVEDPAADGFVLRLGPESRACPVGRCLPQWETKSSAVDIRQNLNTWFRSTTERGDFCDPVDYMRFLTHFVSWPYWDSNHSVAASKPASEVATGEPLDSWLPSMLRGSAHGDLHGRNVHTGVFHERAVWPAVFDYEDMNRANLLGWDFVKMETELKIRAYPHVFPATSMREFVDAVRDFEIELANRTETCHANSNWTEVAHQEDPRTRLLSLLVWLRYQAAFHLGLDRGRPNEWLDEFYFLLACYGISVVRFPNLVELELAGAFVSAGVAIARFLKRRRLPNESSHEDPLRFSPSYPGPLKMAREAIREGGDRLSEGIEQLLELRRRYRHVQAIGQELIFALMQAERHREALTLLKDIEEQFKEVDEETYCRRGRVYKQAAENALEGSDPVLAERYYREALDRYLEAYRLERGHYPGINAASLYLLLAEVALKRSKSEEIAGLCETMVELTNELLATRETWKATESDDTIWHLATLGEAYLLRREWSEATTAYQRAFSEPNAQDFHRNISGRQTRRLISAWKTLGVEVPESEFSWDALFGSPQDR